MALESAGRASTRTGDAGDGRDIAPHRRHCHADRRELIRRLHKCGASPLGELLAEIVAGACPPCRAVVLDLLEYYSSFDSDFVRWAGADDWCEAAAVLRIIARSKS